MSLTPEHKTANCVSLLSVSTFTGSLAFASCTGLEGHFDIFNKWFLYPDSFHTWSEFKLLSKFKVRPRKEEDTRVPCSIKIYVEVCAPW